MKLISMQNMPTGGVERSVGHRPWGAIIMLATVLGGPIAALVMNVGGVTASISALPWWLWIIASPFVLIALLLWVVIVLGMWRSVTACFRRSNWVMKLTFGGLYLQFRSYLNHHFPDEVPTILYLPWADIAAAQESVVHTSEVDSDGHSGINAKRYLDLHLNRTDTEAIRQAIAAETARKQTTKGRSSMRFHHVPVQVPQQGVVRVEWRGRKVLKALKAHLTIRPKRHTGHGHASAVDDRAAVSDDREDQIIKLIEQGNRIAAIRTVRSLYGTSLTEARTFVDDLTQDRTKPELVTQSRVR